MRGKIIENVTLMTQRLIGDIVNKGDICIDATVGNGHDTLFLSELVGEEGFVYGFDVQEQAIAMTKEKMGEKKNYQLFCDGHENMTAYISDPVDFVIFNLGYLPKADKRVTTMKTTTLLAVDAALKLLKTHGILWVVVYPGHDAGAEEAEALETYLSGFNQKAYSVMRIGFINQKNNPPFILGIEKKC